MSASGQFQINAIFRAIDRWSVPVTQMHSKVTALSAFSEKGFKGMTRAADAYVGSIHAGARAVGAFGLAAGAGLAYAAKAGLDFDQQMADVAAVSLVTRGDIQELEMAARRLGRTTKFTATEVGSAMELMGKAGFTNAQILQSIDGVLAAAAAEGAELAETTSHVSNVLKGMGLEADQTARVADVLALAAARTNSSIGSLGESMANVASTAKQFKIPLEQVIGSVALLQDVGLDASVAGSAMNTMLTQLAAPTDKAKEAMRRLGVSFTDVATGDMLPLKDVFAQLMKAMDGSKGNMKDVAFFAELVGLRGQKAAQNLADLFRSGKVSTLFTELELARGSAEKMANLRMDTFNGDLIRLRASVDGLQIDLFDLEKGPMRGVVQGMTKWVDANHALIVSGAREYLDDLGENLPEIIDTGLKIGKVAAGFYAWSVAVKGVKLAVDSYAISARVFGTSAAALRMAASAAGLYNTQLALAGGGLQAMRARLNAGALSAQINGITSTLGKAGLLGAVGAISFGFGTWINEVTGASDAVAKLVAQITGLEGELARSRGLNLSKDALEISKGVIVDQKTGAWLNKPMEGATSATYDKWHSKFVLNQGRAAFGLNREPTMTRERPGVVRRSSEGRSGAWDSLSRSPIQIVTPEVVTRSVDESTTTSKVEIAVSTEGGARAKIKGKPKGPVKMALPSSGTP